MQDTSWQWLLWNATYKYRSEVVGHHSHLRITFLGWLLSTSVRALLIKYRPKICLRVKVGCDTSSPETWKFMVKINFRTKGFKVKDEAPKGHKNATLMGLYICLYTEDPVRLCVCVCVCVYVCLCLKTLKRI